MRKPLFIIASIFALALVALCGVADEWRLPALPEENPGPATPPRVQRISPPKTDYAVVRIQPPTSSQTVSDGIRRLPPMMIGNARMREAIDNAAATQESPSTPTTPKKIAALPPFAATPISDRLDTRDETPNSNTSGPGNGTAFPALPPTPDQHAVGDPLPPLDWELAHHGGSYLYESEDVKAQLDSQSDEHSTRLRLPEGFREPQPFTLFTDFLAPGPIKPWPGLAWLGADGYQWEPRFVGYGSYEVFGIAFEQNRRRADLAGHQLLLDLDLRLTGTERFHVQYRPIGERNTGGSYYMFNNPSGYVDNSTGIPDRYWFEFELDSVFGGCLTDTAVPFDYHVTLGKFPFALHNNLLINDEVLGVAVTKNTILLPPFSNVLVQTFWLPDDVDAFNDGAADVFGAHAQVDHRGAFTEFTYAFVDHRRLADRNVNYAAASYTNFYGPLSLTGRALFKWGDEAGTGAGQLFTLESNFTRLINGGLLCECGVEEAVYYVNGFAATPGWRAISGGNINRLTSSFAVNPLAVISQAPMQDDRYGVAAGVQLFRHHQDESIIPEIAYENAGGADVYGVGLQYLLKLGPRSYLDLRGVGGFSRDPRFRREGAMMSYVFQF